MTRVSHRKRIYETYRDRIQTGAVRHGDRLVDKAIAEEFGVSRMPVREALMQLAHEGYLEGTTRGFTLPNLSTQKILEVFLLRRLLEPYAAASAAMELDPDSIKALETSVKDTTYSLEQRDIGLMFRASELFRNTWTAAVPNDELKQTILRYMAQIQIVRLATLADSGSHKTMVDGQLALLDAFRRKDSLAASDRMLEFVIHGEDCYRRYLDSQGKAAAE